MDTNFFAEKAANLSPKLSAHRRYIHELAEIGFENEKTFNYVMDQLDRIGANPKKCGRAGIVASVGDPESPNTFLLRADMDALPIKEESGEEFAAKNGNMHACGHDMHTAMLLGAAELLKEYENELCGCVRLMFQPAEEILEGALDMIYAGVLDEPLPKGAMMLHVASGVPFRAGKFIIPKEGVGAPACDHFAVKVCGKSSHGATPSLGVDATRAAAHVLLGLFDAASSASFENTLLTVGSFNSGTAANIISDRAVIKGTFRTFDENIRKQALEKFESVSQSTAASLGATASFEVEHSCPPFLNSKRIAGLAKDCAVELFGKDFVILQSELGNSTFGGSEDFSYISQKVPTAVISLTAGNTEKGFFHPLHHPKVKFDESALPSGAALCALCAARFLQR